MRTIKQEHCTYENTIWYVDDLFTYVTIDNAPLFTRLRLLMLIILIEILTEIPLQKQHITCDS